MKTTLLAFVLLLALSTKPLLGAARAALEQVVDISGKKVRAGVSYYIISASPNTVGGLTLENTGYQQWTCPLDAVAVDNYQGLPLVFTPVNAKKGVVRVDTDLNIDFMYDSDCPNSNVWKLKEYDYSTGQWFVTTGGVIGNPGRDTIANWFKIEKYEDAYKLTYCPSPSVCNDCSYPCMDVGIYDDQNYGKRLALSYAPYKVQFQLA